MSIPVSVRTPDPAAPRGAATSTQTGSGSAAAGLPAADSPTRTLQRLDWKVIRRLDGLLQGDYRSLLYGFGVDFSDLREYQPDDDIRYIDWNVTARMGEPYVRQYIEDREISAWFLLDLSPSMDFGTGQTQKRSMLIDLVATLARLLTRHGNRVGAILATNAPAAGSASVRGAAPRQHVIPARSGKVQVLHIINDLMKQPHLQRAPFTDLTPLLNGGLRSIRRRSLVFVISDFICAPGWERPLRLLTQRHETLTIRLWDPRETELPDAGTLVMEDAETGEQIVVDTSDARFRARFAEAARRRETALRDAFKHAGVDALSLSTDEDLVRALVRFASLRRQRARGRLV